ncbi:MAG TPA: VOC family protein [Steroidobacteraceae bacterium]|nr:VOC family protein [Steroidobacteraceae bacterium]
MSTRRVLGITAAACAAFMLVAAARADVSLNAARVGGPDVPALAKFYESAFGLKEVNRFQLPGAVEILMNFGDTVEAAKSNQAAQIVIMHRPEPLKDAVPHLILNVSDVNATAEAVKAAGGTMQGAPRQFGKSGIFIGIAVDPAGNLIEMIQRPKR